MLSQIVEDQDYRNLRNVLPSYIPPNLYPRSAFETRIKSYEGQRYDAQFKLVNKKKNLFLKKKLVRRILYIMWAKTLLRCLI